MRGFRAGEFDRDSAGGLVRRIMPSRASETLSHIDLEQLASDGKKCILIDADNTLLPWRSLDIPQETLDWIAKGRSLGIRFCIISNTRNKARLEDVANRLGAFFVEGKFKPSREMFHKAMDVLGVTADECVMIGDQLFTDIFGANRAGIDAIWVKQMHPREFAGTKINRMAELLARPAMYRYLVAEDEVPFLPPEGVMGSPVVRQFVRFALVGGTCFVIDAGLHRYLLFHAQWGAESLAQRVGQSLWAFFHAEATAQPVDAHDSAFVAFKVVSASVAIIVSFLLNRSWTFGIKGREKRASQFGKFVIVSVIGLLLNVAISSSINRLIGGGQTKGWGIGTVVAAGVVAFWNFGGQRLWAFRERKKL